MFIRKVDLCKREISFHVEVGLRSVQKDFQASRDFRLLPDVELSIKDERFVEGETSMNVLSPRMYV